MPRNLVFLLLFLLFPAVAGAESYEENIAKTATGPVCSDGVSNLSTCTNLADETYLTTEADPGVTTHESTYTHGDIAHTNRSALDNVSGTNTGDNAANSNYASDYRAGNFVAGTHYVAPTGSGAGLTGITPAQVGAATSAQGGLADTALQPADVGTAAAQDVGYFATAAQGSTADTALQPADMTDPTFDTAAWSAVTALGSQTTSFSVDFATSQTQAVTLTANTITLTLDTTTIGIGGFTLWITNGGLATLTWAAETGSVLWPGGTDPALTSSGVDVVTCKFNGTNFYCAATLDFQ